MSLSTLLEAAKFLEMQEQQQQHRATLESALATIKPLCTVASTQNGGQAITLSQSKPSVTTVVPQTVVISSPSVSSTLFQGPISFAPTATNQQVVKKMEQDGQISSTTLTQGQQQQRQRVLHNSFDIMNPLIIDEGSPMDQKKLKQPPLVFRAGTREVHNKLEKHRRAHLKECFDTLKKQLPSSGDEKKTSNLSILHSALRYIQSLKRKERELEHEMERLAREKITAQQRLAVLKKDISSHYGTVDFSKLLPDIVPTSTNNNSEINNGQSVTSNGEVTTTNTMEPKVEFIPQSNVAVVSPNASLNSNSERIAIPILSKPAVTIANHTPITTIREVNQPVQTAALSVLPMSYPVNQGLVLQKVAIVPHNGLKDLTPLMSTHFITTTPQHLNGINGQLNGKVVPLAQYLVKPVVVVSTASPRPSS